jgi:hypothetical protein
MAAMPVAAMPMVADSIHACADNTCVGSTSMLQTGLSGVKVVGMSSTPAPTYRFIENESEIVVGSYRHSDQMAPRWSSKGILGIRRSLERPEWAKSYRCLDDSQSTCEECSILVTKPRWEMTLNDSANCWDHGGYAHQARAGPRIWVDVNQPWVKYSYSTHIRCEAAEAQINFAVFDIGYGTLKYFFDGEQGTTDNPNFHVYFGFVPHFDDHPIDLNSPIESFNTWALPKGTGATWRNVINMIVPLTGPGPHEFVLEFLPYPDRKEPAFANIQEIRMFMPPSYATCEDTKACLSKLSGARAAPLRNNNTLQRECLLSTPAPGSQCHTWRDCLNSSTEEVLLSLLNAALPPTAGASLIESAPRQNTGVQCMNPVMEDPEAWMCDCFESMMGRCKAIGEESVTHEGSASTDVCIRAQYCLYDYTCDDWKAESCHDAEVTNMMERLNAQSSSLIAQESPNRSSSSALMSRTVQASLAHGKETSMEETMQLKQCS